MSGMPSMTGAPPRAHALRKPSCRPHRQRRSQATRSISTTSPSLPATLTVKAGSTVTWTNHDEEPHTVAATDGSFHSPGMGTGATFSHTFPTAGTFDYVCSIHPMMHGTVVVTQ